MNLNPITKLMQYVSQLFLSYVKPSEIPKDSTLSQEPVAQVEEPKKKVNIPQDNGILVLPSNFDFAELSIQNAAEIQSLIAANKVIRIDDLHSPAIVQ